MIPEFTAVHRTRIGSPYVVAAMEAALAADAGAKVTGYEANGGFLTGFDAQGPARPLAALMTRDCLLPVIARPRHRRSGRGAAAAVERGCRCARGLF